MSRPRLQRWVLVRTAFDSNVEASKEHSVWLCEHSLALQIIKTLETSDVALIVLMENDENVPTAFAGYASVQSLHSAPPVVRWRLDESTDDKYNYLHIRWEKAQNMPFDRAPMFTADCNAEGFLPHAIGFGLRLLIDAESSLPGGFDTWLPAAFTPLNNPGVFQPQISSQHPQAQQQQHVVTTYTKSKNNPVRAKQYQPKNSAPTQPPIRSNHYQPNSVSVQPPNHAVYYQQPQHYNQQRQPPLQPSSHPSQRSHPAPQPARPLTAYMSQTSNSVWKCETCNVQCESLVTYTAHMSGRPHLLNSSFKIMKSKNSQFWADKEGIEVESDIWQPMSPGNSQSVAYRIINRGNQTAFLCRVGVLRKSKEISVEENHEIVQIPPNRMYKISVTCRPSVRGVISNILVFVFAKFVIGRRAFVRVSMPTTLHEELAPVAPYKKQYRPNHKSRQIVVGEKPPGFVYSNLRNDLDLYLIPQALQDVIDSNNEEALDVRMGPSLTLANYRERMDTLLHLEEAQMNIDIRKYDLSEAVMAQDGLFLNLDVPGLAEKRPSVLYGDSVYASVSGDPDGSMVEYQGFVHNVRLDSVSLKFAAHFHRIFVAGMKFSIRFSFSRVPLRRMHQAIRLVEPSSIFGSSYVPPLAPFQPAGISLFNSKLNDQQVNAVEHVLKPDEWAAKNPFVIWGPPGTGKTSTLIEVIKQLLTTNPDAKILACAPSNTASDLILTRLASGRGPISTTRMFRLNAPSRNPMEVDKLVKDYSFLEKERGTDRFSIPDRGELKRFSVIVATCISAGLIYSLGVDSGHFSYICIDEAGQATEPEVIVPLAGLFSPQCRMILAGDHMQLGPVIRSSAAVKYGLGVSLLERIMQFEIYHSNNGKFDERVIVKLLRNYRSHPALLELPSRLFYESELIPCADKMITHSLHDFEDLPKKKFPMIFHGIIGKDDREANSPSWFNIDEISEVVDYVKALLSNRALSVTPREIGIISPYRKQVQRLRKALQSLKIRDIQDLMVGSVEEFQGQERLVIIVTTVRSNTDNLTFDYHHNLGFLKNPKRFNVAITRPQALLIVVGNPLVLKADQHWAALIDYAAQHGAYTGCDLPKPMEEEEAAVEEALRDYSLLDVEGVQKELASMQSGPDISAVAAETDPEWRTDD